MYPGYRLGTGVELERAMELGVRLAVDVSHLFIQQTAGVLEDRTLRRVLASAHIVEVHVSQNDGRHDSHRPLRRDSFELGWARERLQHGVPVIYEAYLHVVSEPSRRAQLELVRETLT
jgi:sugar phosphate isomerase/epimerase